MSASDDHNEKLERLVERLRRAVLRADLKRGPRDPRPREGPPPAR